MKYFIFLFLIAFINPVFADKGHCKKHETCQGEKGDKGDQGEQGEIGPQGIAGIDGQNGIDGSNGSNGSNGLDGSDGSDGAAGVAGLNGVDGLDAEGISNEDFNTGIASMIALSNIDFSSSTKQWQIGLGAGLYDGEQALAFGVGKLVPKYDMLFKASGTVANDNLGVGFGLVWKVK